MWMRYLLFVALVVVVAAVVVAVQRTRERLATGRAGGGALGSGADARHDEAVAAARKQLRKARKEHARAVRRAEKALARAGTATPIVSVGPVVLRPLTITLRGAEHPLSEGTTFDLEVVGEVTSLVKDRRVVADDRREVYLTVTDLAWGDVVKLSPDQLEGARRLVAAGEAAVRTLEQAREQRAARVEAARAELDRVRADTSAMDLARMTLEDLEGAPPQRLDLPDRHQHPEQDGQRRHRDDQRTDDVPDDRTDDPPDDEDHEDER